MSNHKAIVTRVTEVIEIPGADRVQISVVLGEHCVTSKDVKVGDVGILFPVDVQLSEEFCRENNLFRDKEKNRDQTKAGFFESNRRVRAQPFLKVRSEGLFMPVDCVKYTGVDTENTEFTVGVSFDELNGRKICQKYINEKTQKEASNQQPSAKRKVAVPDFLEHGETEHFKYSAAKIKKGDVLFFHSKRHGTSGRSGLHKVNKKLGMFKTKLNVISQSILGKEIFDSFEWEYVTGSRRVVLNSAKSSDGFHGSNQFRFDITESLKPYLEKGFTFYYEIVGYVNGSPIMAKHDVKTLKDKRYIEKYGDVMEYSYGCKEHEYKVFIYRITVQDQNGNIRDLSQKELEKFCKDRELGYTLEVHEPIVYDGDELKLRHLVEELTERWDVLSQDYEGESHVTEGIIIRCENGGSKPIFMKSKGYAFRVMEGHETAVNVEDIN